MKTIKILFSMVIILLITSSTIAQEKKLTEVQKEKAKEQLEQYLKKLNLTEAQKTSYEEIVKKHEEQLKFIKNSGLSKQKKLKELQLIQAKKDSELQELLSDDQYIAYLDFKSSQRNSLLKNYSGEFAEYFNKLNLTNTQKPKFKEISTRYAAQLVGLKNSSKSRLSKYRAYKSIQSAKAKEMKKLLSPDQYDVYKKIQKEVQKKIKERRSK